MHTTPQVTSARVEAATGKSTEDWFALLDTLGATAWPHARIARLLGQEHHLEGWWAQQLTVQYEQARGLRAKHQRPDGYAITKSKTVGAPAALVQRAWLDEAQRGQWLDGALTVTSSQPGKSVRGRWGHGEERIAVLLSGKDGARTAVAVQHARLADADEAEEAKAAWAARLDALERFLAS